MSVVYSARQGDEITIRLDTGKDISTALAVAIDWKDPEGNTGTWTGTESTPYITYNTSATDLSVAGTWELQAFVRKADSKEVHGDPVKMVVGPLSAGKGHTHA